MGPFTDEAVSLAGIRRGLLVILLLGMAGMAIELLLLDHFEDTTQLIPLGLLAVGVAVVAWNALGGGRGSVLVVQIVMVLFVAAGVAGAYFHYRANAEFQREIDPTLGGAALLWATLRAKTPPALAPGMMVQLGLIGLAYAYRQPARSRGDALEEDRLEENRDES